MDFGFAHIPSHRIEENVALAKTAESLGYDWVWVADQTFYPDPYVVLAMSARSTKDIRLGLGVTNPYTRHPAMTARAAATLDELSDQRFTLGIGAGNQKELVFPLGLKGEAPARACQEAVEVIRAFWAGSSVHFDGQHFQIDGLRLEFPARPRIPLFIGGRGRLILSLAGRTADGVILSLSAMDRSTEIVEEAAREAGRDPNVIYRVAWGECAILDAGADVELYRLRLAHSLWRAPSKGLKVSNIPQTEIAQIKESFERGGAEEAAKHVSDDTLRQQIILGDSKECADQLAALEAKGVSAYALLLKETAFDKKKEAIEVFAANVMSLMG